MEVDVAIEVEVVLVVEMLEEESVASASRAAKAGNAGGEVTRGATPIVRVRVWVARRANALRAANSHCWSMIPPLPPVSPMVSSPEEERHDTERPGVEVTRDRTVVEGNVKVNGWLGDAGVDGSKEEAPVMFMRVNSGE